MGCGGGGQGGREGRPGTMSWLGGGEGRMSLSQKQEASPDCRCAFNGGHTAALTVHWRSGGVSCFSTDVSGTGTKGLISPGQRAREHNFPGRARRPNDCDLSLSR